MLAKYPINNNYNNNKYLCGKMVVFLIIFKFTFDDIIGIVNN